MEKATEEFLLGGFIECRTDLVEQQHRTWAKQSASNGYALSLTFTQSAAMFGKHSVEAFRKVEHKICTGGVKGKT